MNDEQRAKSSLFTRGPAISPDETNIMFLQTNRALASSRSRPAFGVDSDFGTLRSVLMAEPDALALVSCNSVSAQSIREGREPDQARARRQHALLVSTLEDEGVDIQMVEAAEDLPDLAFTRDTSLMTPWGLVGLAPGAPHRRRETDAILDYVRREGIPILDRIEEGRIEGGDIAYLRPGLIAIGVSGDRTDEDGAMALMRMFERRGWRSLICRFDPHFLHLDTQFCMVDHGLAVACTDVLDDHFVRQVGDLGIDIIPACYKDVRRLGCNVLALGDRRVVASGDCSAISSALALRGYHVISIDLSEFAMCGGAVHCLTMPLARDRPAC